MWFSRAYKNLPALGASDLRYKTGWAIGGWFVPILWLWRPKQIANDIWRASDPESPLEQGEAWRTKLVPTLLTAWWVAWIAAADLGNVVLRLSIGGDTAEDFRMADYADLVRLVLDIVAASLAIVVVLRITRRQADRAHALAAVPRTAEPFAGSDSL